MKFKIIYKNCIKWLLLTFFISCSSNKVVRNELISSSSTLSPGDSVRIETSSNKNISGFFNENKNGVIELLIQQEPVLIHPDSIKYIEVINNSHEKKPNIYVTIALTLFVIVSFGVCSLFSSGFGGS